MDLGGRVVDVVTTQLTVVAAAKLLSGRQCHVDVFIVCQWQLLLYTPKPPQPPSPPSPPGPSLALNPNLNHHSHWHHPQATVNTLKPHTLGWACV